MIGHDIAYVAVDIAGKARLSKRRGRPIIVRMRPANARGRTDLRPLPDDLLLIFNDINGMREGGVLSPEDEAGLKRYLDDRIMEVFG